MITFTNEAAEKISEFAKDHPQTLLRVGVKGGGCSGFEYKMGFIKEDEYIEETMHKYEENGITFVVEKSSVPFIAGSTVKWEENIMQRGFVFDNPNATGSCGCKKSFSV